MTEAEQAAYERGRADEGNRTMIEEASNAGN